MVRAATPRRPPPAPIGTNFSRYPAKLIATAAIAPLAIISQVIHPRRNAGSRPNASRTYTYPPPASGSIAPSSAYVSAPARATTPPSAHTPSTHGALGSARAVSAGGKKDPPPMIPPPTSRTAAEKSRSSLRSPASGVRFPASTPSDNHQLPLDLDRGDDQLTRTDIGIHFRPNAELAREVDAGLDGETGAGNERALFAGLQVVEIRARTVQVAGIDRMAGAVRELR